MRGEGFVDTDALACVFQTEDRLYRSPVAHIFDRAYLPDTFGWWTHPIQVDFYCSISNNGEFASLARVIFEYVLQMKILSAEPAKRTCQVVML